MDSQNIRINSAEIKSIHQLLEYISSIVALIDTVEIFIRWPPRGLRKQVEAVTGREAHIVDCANRETGEIYGVRVIANSPSRNTLAFLSDLARRRSIQACVHRVDVAIDFTTKDFFDAAAMLSWLHFCINLKWPPKNYSKRIIGQTGYSTKGNKARNPRVYSRFSKTEDPTDRNVIRYELAFKSAGAVRRARLDDLPNLDKVDVRKLLLHNLKAEIPNEDEILKCVKRTYADAIAESRKSKRNCSFADTYTVDVPHKVRSLLLRLQYDHGLNAVRTDRFNLDLLNLPKQICWS